MGAQADAHLRAWGTAVSSPNGGQSPIGSCTWPNCPRWTPDFTCQKKTDPTSRGRPSSLTLFELKAGDATRRVGSRVQLVPDMGADLDLLADVEAQAASGGGGGGWRRLRTTAGHACWAYLHTDDDGRPLPPPPLGGRSFLCKGVAGLLHFCVYLSLSIGSNCMGFWSSCVSSRPSAPVGQQCVHTACNAHTMKPSQGGREEITLHLRRRHKGLFISLVVSGRGQAQSDVA